MSDSSHAARPDRRRFLVLMGFAGIAPALSRPLLASAEGPGSPAARGTGAPPDTTAPAKPEPEKEPSAEALALAEYVKRRYGARLDEAQLRSITKDLDGRLDGGRKLHALALANGDEPDFTFRA